MLIDCKQKSALENYFLMIQTIIPRPIAWVISDNGNGSHNLAPFSFFNAVASNPPIIMMSIGWKDEYTQKDTWVNIENRKHFVVHIPSKDDIKNVALSAATLAHGISELEQINLPLEYIEGQSLPKLKGPKIAFFCEKYAIHEIGADKQALILGQINHIWLSDDIVKQDKDRMIIDAAKVDPLTRLGGNEYGSLGEVLTMKRPD